jgi:RimJ/RimL family protein N-acetyltransferase
VERMSTRFAYRIVTDRLVIRCYEPKDAPMLHAVVTASKSHLETFLPWARLEPTSLEQKVELLRTFRGRFDLGQDYAFGVFLKDTGELVGGNGLMPRIGPGGLEIGYWTAKAHANRGFCTESSAALTKYAIVSLGIDRVEIHCEPANGPSNAVPRKLGYEREATLRRRFPFSESDLRDLVIWTMFRERMERSDKVNWARYEAFDAMDRPIP